MLDIFTSRVALVYVYYAFYSSFFFGGGGGDFLLFTPKLTKPGSLQAFLKHGAKLASLKMGPLKNPIKLNSFCQKKQANHLSNHVFQFPLIFALIFPLIFTLSQMFQMIEGNNSCLITVVGWEMIIQK